MHPKKSTLSVLSVCISMALSHQTFADTAHLSSAPVNHTSSSVSAPAESACPENSAQLTESQKAAVSAECPAEQASEVEKARHGDQVLLSVAGTSALLGVVAVAANHASNGSGSPHNGGSDGGSGGNTDGGSGGDTDGGSGGDTDGGSGGDTDGGADGGKNYDDWDVKDKREGDGQINHLPGGGQVDTGQIGHLIVGDNTKNILNGDTSVAEGGKGVVIDGNASHTSRDGEGSITGEAAIGVEVNGDNAIVDNNGPTNIAAGGTAVVINGDGATVNNNGDSSVTGEGSTGLIVNGEGGRVNLNGDIAVREGATGVSMTGARSSILNTGTITVKDLNSTGVKLTSDDLTFTNKGTISVSDNATGVLISGDRFQAAINGNMAVEAGENRLSATGASITGNQGVLNVKGNVDIRDILMAAPGENVPDLTGVKLAGQGNTLIVDGAVNFDYQGVPDSMPLRPARNTGILVTGEDNSITLNGGINMRYEVVSEGEEQNDHNYSSGIAVTGNNNSIVVSGTSSWVTSTGLAGVNNQRELLTLTGENNRVLLDSGFSLDADYHFTPEIYTGASKPTLFMITGKNNLVQNAGEIELSGNNSLNLMYVEEGAAFINQGHISYLGEGAGTSFYPLAYADNATLTNAENGKFTLRKSLLPASFGLGGRIVFEYGGGNTLFAMTVRDGGEALNAGTIDVAGAGAFGLLSNNGRVINSGTITLDSLQLLTDDSGAFTGKKTAWSDADATRLRMRGAGMYAYGAKGYALNSADIAVANSGFGMVADQPGSVAVNQGTITLTSDHADAGLLYGLGAFNGGLALNDTTGAIVINTDAGQAFYTDGSSQIINRGTVKVNNADADADAAEWGTGNILNHPVIYDAQRLAAGESLTVDNLLFFNASTRGDIYNAGTIDVNAGGELLLTGKAWLVNKGSLKVNPGGKLDRIMQLYNTGTLTTSGGSDLFAGQLVNGGTLTGTTDGAAVVSGNVEVFNLAEGVISNGGKAVKGADNYLISQTASKSVINSGKILATDGYGALTSVPGPASISAWVHNTPTGLISGTGQDSKVINLNRGTSLFNQGEIRVQGNNATAIYVDGTAYEMQAINAGVINVGTEQGQKDGTNGTGLVGISASGARTTVNNRAEGVINVWANDSWAFDARSAKATFINNGQVNLLCGDNNGCGIFKAGTATEGSDMTTPSPAGVPTLPTEPSQSVMVLSNYVIGTNSNGTAGSLTAGALSVDPSVSIDTGFAAGTDSKEVTFNNVLVADSVTGQENIHSTSAVWSAKSGLNDQGNVDVTLTKKAYAEVITDGRLNNLADALDAGYTNNALFNSLNVTTPQALDRALMQVSGAQATSLNQEARVLGQRFTLLAENAPVTSESGLSFNLVAKGDKRAEMSNKVTYDMMALGQRFDTSFGQLTATYGMARLTGSGGNSSQRAGDNGLTGGYSQFFGFNQSLKLGESSRWNNSLRYDLYQLNSSRQIGFEGVNRIATTSGRQQHMAFRSEGVREFELQPGLTVSPFAGVKLRHQINDGYQEQGAGDFNLTMSRYSETAVDVVTGLRLNYAGQNGWGAHATLEAGPNLSFSQSGRQASLEGLQGQKFNVESGKKSGSLNGQALLGVNYQAGNVTFGMNAYHWKEDGASDRGFLLNLERSF